MSEITGGDGQGPTDATAGDSADLTVTPELFGAPGGGDLPTDPTDPDGAEAAMRYTRGGTPC